MEIVTNQTNSEFSWYAVSVRSRQEKVAARTLESLGITTFLPTVTEIHRWSDRKMAVTIPLFSCYLFVFIPPSNNFYHRVVQAPGVLSFVGTPRGPLSIPNKEIENVRSVLSQRSDCSTYPFLQVGERVRIVGGALNGVEGILIGRGGESKLVISIELIHRSLAVSVYDLNVVPVGMRSCVAA